MKKRLFAILSLTLLIVSMSFSFSVHATEAVIPNTYLPGLFDISYGLTNGATIDLSGYDDANEFINEYTNRRFNTPIMDAIGMFIDLTSDDAFGPSSYYSYDFPLNYGMTNTTFNLLGDEYNEYLLDTTDPIIAGFSIANIAYWNRYNNQYMLKYLNDLTISANPPTVYVPEQYVELAENCGSTYVGSYPYYILPTYDRNNSYQFVFAYQGSIYSDSNFDDLSVTSRSLYFSSNIASVYLDTSNYTITLVDWSGTPFTYLGNNNSYNWLQTVSFNNSRWNARSYGNVTNSYVDYRGTQTYDAFVTWCLHRFRNVYLYVDNALWVYPGVISDDVIATAPDVIFGDDGRVEGQDVFLPVDPTDNLGFDLNKLWDLINDTIADPDKDVITFDDLVDGGVIVKDDGTTAEDTDIKQESLTNVISEAEADDDDTLDDNPTGDSIIPPLPPILQFKNFGNAGDPTKAFDGISVLARIINVTNKSLPEELMYVFWGIIFGMITLGIIKILHK